MSRNPDTPLSAEGHSPRPDPGHDALHIARWAEGLLDRFSVPLYVSVIGAFAVLFLLASWFLTVEADEAWILLNTMHVFGIALPPTEAIQNPTLTSGGLHLLLQGLVSVVHESILAHRAVSLISAGALTVIVYRLFRSFDHPPPIAWSGTALFIAVPGFIFQAALAMAEIVATTLLILACIHWTRRGSSSASSAIVSGLLLGLASATRVNCVIALPAILAWSLLSGRDWRPNLLRAMVAALVALAVFGLAFGLYMLSARAQLTDQTSDYLSQSTGLGLEEKGRAEFLRYLVISNAIFPVWAIAAVTAAFFPLARGGRRVRETGICGLLLLVGLFSWVAWVVKAPIPHVRYLWPALPCLWLAGAVELTSLMSRTAKPIAGLVRHAVILSACAYQWLAGALVVAHGESLTLVYQANGLSPVVMLKPRFHAAYDQNSVARFVAAQPAQARFFALTPPVHYPITYLSRRTVEPIRAVPANGPRYILIAPADFAMFRPSTAFISWLQANGTPVLQSGNFGVLQVRDGARRPPQDRLEIGENDLVQGR